MLQSWLIDVAEVRPAGAKGRGVFTTQALAQSTVVSGFGGHVLGRREFSKLPIDQQVHSLQIAEDLFMVCLPTSEPADFFNHSCEPNLGVEGNILLVATRDIAAGEELTFDYAMCDSDAYDEFECECQTPSCRTKVTGNDWMIPELQQRYRGNFSSYLERKIIDLNRSVPNSSGMLNG
ncbi:MAG TPA: SET domain-containing protein-lysine N-methyltransferase [Acidimicrobiaceae bacterium]|jgi:hypothetical protein|nr:SET domain-containing protein-lysine N-methyltransferase [Acidimicrobiaceae bacterium]